MPDLIVDTDAGVDDAIALLMALAHPTTRLMAVTTVCGNVAVEQVTRNVCLILDQLGHAAPVYPGCDRPLMGRMLHAGGIHGEDGLGNVAHTLPSSTHRPQDEPAAQALVRLGRENAGKFTLLALGPLTNLALALRLDPGFAQNVARLVVMGGAIEAHGNASAAAEFNILADPEAAAIVFEAGFPELWLLSWETTLKYPLAWDRYETLAAKGTRQAAFFKQITAYTAHLLRDTFAAPGFLLPDPLAAAVALQPDLVRQAPHVAVNIELAGAHGRGLTSVDWRGLYGQPPNANVVTDLDEGLFFDLLEAGLGA
jgi:purine nucleosidase